MISEIFNGRCSCRWSQLFSAVGIVFSGWYSFQWLEKFSVVGLVFSVEFNFLLKTPKAVIALKSMQTAENCTHH